MKFFLVFSICIVAAVALAEKPVANTDEDDYDEDAHVYETEAPSRERDGLRAAVLWFLREHRKVNEKLGRSNDDDPIEEEDYDDIVNKIEHPLPLRKKREVSCKSSNCGNGLSLLDGGNDDLEHADMLAKEMSRLQGAKDLLAYKKSVRHDKLVSKLNSGGSIGASIASGRGLGYGGYGSWRQSCCPDLPCCYEVIQI